MKLKAVSGTMLTLLLASMLTVAFNIPSIVADTGTAELPSDYRMPRAGEKDLSAADFMNVTVSVAKNIIDSVQSLVVIDVRTAEEYSDGHIENAVLIPLPILEGRIDELDKLEETLIYCKSGKKSTTACGILFEKGFVNVYNMLGGIEAWEDAGYPLTPPAEGNGRASNSYTCTNARALDYSVHLRDRTETAEDDLQNIRDAILNKGAKWIADETSVSRLTFEERRLLCGAKFGPIPERAERLSTPPGVIPFGTFDWRNVNGTDWMTSVKDQGACGSCWAFGTLGSMEAVINIVENDPDMDMDLSEQFLVSCCDECGDCGGGYPSVTYNFIMNTGIPDESCFPYVASNVPCNPCSDWADRAWFITDWIWVSNDSDSIKGVLQTRGPLGVAMRVPDDFLLYKSGIYEPVWSSPEWNETFPFSQANHWVTLVGYDDVEEYWIVKNSWGSGWGEEGYGKIAYGVLEQYDYILAIISVEGPTPPEHDLTVSVQVPLYLQPGSDSLLNATVQNRGLNNETNVELFLLINGSMVNSTTISELLTGESYTINYLWTPTVEVMYNVTAYAPPVAGENFTANNVESVIVFVQALPDILIVNDDDGGSWISGTSLPEFESALTVTGYDYWVWNESSMGNPSLDFLTKFKLVIWTCGDYWGWAVDPVDAVTLESYLAQGGNILLEGEDIGYDHDADDFMVNVAHAIMQVDDTGAPGLTVTDPTHPVTFGLPTNFTWLTDPPYDDGVSPTNGGAEVIQYTGTTWTAVTVFEGASNGSVVYYAFPLYCLEQSHGETLAINSVNWLLAVPPTEIHDVAIISVTTSATEVYEGQIVNITVVAKNEGNVTETFNVATHYDASIIGIQTVTNLTAGANVTLPFSWDTTGVEPSIISYTIKAVATPVPGETDTADNTYLDGSVKVKMLGDVNGDGTVNIQDIVICALAFGSRPGDPNWNPIADLNGDNIVNIVDLVIIGVNFGKRLPPGFPRTTVYVNPQSTTATVGETFTVNVKIFNVTDLYAYDFKLYYDTAILDGVDATLPPGHFLTPVIDPGNIFIVKLEVNDAYNVTHGLVRVTVALLRPEPSKNGSGTLATITFKATATGSSTLDLADTELINTKPELIPHDVIDGYVAIISAASTTSVNLKKNHK